ncbi:MAG TPA: DUF4374 domain-containing protein [Cyclobacteriaceae bacterium]|nr:DUF4374 domain-containing protein [Cyclobacteriaceae bacterium]
MKKNTTNLLGCIALAVAVSFGCSEDNDAIPGGPEAGARYIIASTPIASDGVADYLLTADDLRQGTISTVGNGIEQDGTYRYYVTHNNRFFSMLYGQGNPGAVTTYELNPSGQLTKISDFQAETVQAFAPVNDDILLMKIPRSGAANASWYSLDTELLQIVGEGQINIEEVAANGERAHFTWLTQVGDKVFAPYMSIKGCCNDTFGTNYPDSAWIAVFSYPSMELEKVIKDDRASYIGRYFTNGLIVDEKGDVYAFSPAVATNNSSPTSTTPSAYLKIKKGETAFDPSYYLNIEELTGGYHVTDQTYLGEGKSLVILLDEKGPYATGNQFGIVDLYEGSFKWITGTPDPAQVVKVTNNNYSEMDGKTAYVGITTNEGSYVYVFDADSGTAIQGLHVEGGTITAISRLEVK